MTRFASSTEIPSFDAISDGGLPLQCIAHTRSYIDSSCLSFAFIAIA